MKSISAKVILWTVAALLVSLAVFILVSQLVIGRTLIEGLDRFSTLHFQQARAVYQSGGPAGLSKYLGELNRVLGSDFYLTDGSGKDLASGADRSELVQGMAGQRRWNMRRGNGIVLGVSSSDGRYLWLTVARQRFSPMVFAPFYLLVLATVGALYWLVTTRVAVPLRRLAGLVDRFGRGELGARAVTVSKDEIGNLGRSFNAMADRIQTLLTAERQLLQDVSHELRSPLARLTFEAEMVRMTADRDASAVRLRHEIERLSELVGTLLDMARLEGDPATVEMEEVCLNELLQGIGDDCAVEAAARQCSVSLAAPPEAVTVRGNGELLHRAFENVVRNAIHYSPPGAVVEVSLHRAAASITVDVRDYGPGIPGNVMSRIFDPFFRVDSSRDQSTGGLGLGLAIARRAVRVHHGDLTAENLKPGARFRIVIPEHTATAQ
jgi:signal transduction histidine kinase